MSNKELIFWKIGTCIFIIYELWKICILWNNDELNLMSIDLQLCMQSVLLFILIDRLGRLNTYIINSLKGARS